MSEKPQLESDLSGAGVSRETVDLNEIMARSMPKAPNPPEEGTEKEAPPQNETPSPPDQEASPSPPGKNKRSSFYVYLIILFGAAFMMLLLAYFIQQRNNETAISDLRNTMNLSREELMEQIEALEEENKSLQQDKELLNLRLDQVKEERETLKQETDQQYYMLQELIQRTTVENVLDYLELFVDTKDWLIAGTIIAENDWYFNSLNAMFNSSNTLPSQTERYLELRETVLKQDVIILEEVFRHRWSEPRPNGESRAYYEQPRLQDGLFDEQDCQTANMFAGVLAWYPTRPGYAAFCFERNFPDADSLDQLNSGAFRPSTVELFEQIKADLIAQNYLVEHEDGTMSAVIYYGGEGSTADVSRETSED